MKTIVLFLLVTCYQCGFGQTDTSIVITGKEIHLKPLSELTLRISVPSKDIRPDGTVSAFLILSNSSPQSIRFTKLSGPARETGPGGRFDVTWRPGWFFSDAPTIEQLVKSVQTLRPGESVEWPFEIIVGTNKILEITAHYDTDFAAKELDLSRGHVDAEPLTIRFDK
jgi:hypothetical protein